MFTKESIEELVQKQRTFFETHKTLDVSFRIQQLKKLEKAIKAHEEELEDALHEDLGRTKVEAYLCDIGPVLVELHETLHGLRKWAKPEKHTSGLLCFPSITTTVYKMPYGVSLIISPFNFPILLTLGVLIASIAGGNTSVIKTSSKSSACTKALQNLIKETFDESYVAVVDGGHDIADYCLETRFDKIFYTGSPSVAKHVMEEASHNLTPVALELGGETGNWCIIRKDADLKDAARKIAFFKLCNAGQICININQIAVAEEVAEEFLACLKEAFITQLGEHPESHPEYPCLISQGAYLKCVDLSEQYKDRIYFGGTGNPNTKKFAPTIFYPINAEEELVKHELFSPLLPVVPYKDADIDSMLSTIANREHPLAFYLFTKDLKWANRVMQEQQYGGGCINEVCLHMMVKGVPFNGTGHSGMGAYHGEWGFREFTHPQTVLKGSTHFNLSLREHPYTGKHESLKLKILKLLER